MMDEATLIARAKVMLDTRLAGKYKMKVVGRKKETVSTMMVTLAVICKEGNITNDLIVDLVDDEINTNDEIRLVETRLDLGDLDSEVLLLEAEITYLKD